MLLEYAGERKALLFVGLGLSAVSMLCSMVPYICVWLIARDLIEAYPNVNEATEIFHYAWVAFLSAFAGIAVYFAALICTHLAAFRTAFNIRKRGMERVMKAPLGYFDLNASGLIRSRLDAAAADTETLLAHNLADIVGTVTLFVSMLIMMVLFDWRMGLACLACAVISVAALFTMMGGKNADLMMQQQVAVDEMSKAGTEYVRGIPVVKIFQQTVYSFRAFQKAIDNYSEKAEAYTARACRLPQTVNLTFTEGAFVFLIPLAFILAPTAIASGNFAAFITDFVFYAVFSAILSTALSKIMFASSGMMLADTAMERIRLVMEAPELSKAESAKVPNGSDVEFRDVSFTYDGTETPAIEHISFTAKAGTVTALVGPSGGGKTTIATLVPRFFDVTEGSVLVGGTDVREIDPHVLMDNIAFVFQNTGLLKTSILENVRLARPDVSREEVMRALDAAQCADILAKLPSGIDTLIGPEGTYLSGGEQQRIALARAILKDAPIIVLDEATAFADPENEELIQKALRSLTKERTVIMIAHRLSTVVGADNIIVLDKGHIVSSGTHEELVKAGGLYTAMWEDYNKSVLWKISGKEAV